MGRPPSTTRAALRPCAPRDTPRRYCARARQSHAWRTVSRRVVAACRRYSRCRPASAPYWSSPYSNDITVGATRPTSLPDFAVTRPHSPEYGSRPSAFDSLPLAVVPALPAPETHLTLRRRYRSVECFPYPASSLTLLE